MKKTYIKILQFFAVVLAVLGFGSLIYTMFYFAFCFTF